MKVAIIGAGPTGLTIAYELSKTNISVDIFDSSKDIGGFARTIDVWKKNVEIGPHFLSIGRLPVVEALIRETLQNDYTIYGRKTYLLTKNKSFNYPPTVNDIVKKLNIFELTALIGSFLKRSSAPVNDEGTAEHFIIAHLGTYLYKYFFAGFLQKLWGANGTEISDQFAKSLLGFSSGFSPVAVLYKKLFKPNSVTDTYIYPKGGLSTLWEKMKVITEHQGGRFLLSTNIESVAEANSNSGLLTHIKLANGQVLTYDYFIFTIPVEQIIAYLPGSKSATALPALKFRADVLIYVKVAYDKAAEGQCYYVYDQSNAITRITNFSRFQEHRDDDFMVLLLEFWCSTEDAIWNADKNELWHMARTELEKTVVFSGLTIMDIEVKKVAKAFQVPEMNYINNKQQLLKQLQPWQNLKVTGRTTSVNFNYGMENAIDDGIRVARELMANYQPELFNESV
ncbi:hypothetical protein A0256_13400 [Mucilaginibacter sp. PAMC 26640]|nr:hypothetical protein A0256_13400 [Mucilaginibacter sp. PAMC 26640]